MECIQFDAVVVVRGVGGAEVCRIARRVDRALTAEEATAIRANGLRYTDKLELAAGSYGVWIVLRDVPSGRIGSTISILNVK